MDSLRKKPIQHIAKQENEVLPTTESSFARPHLEQTAAANQIRPLLKKEELFISQKEVLLMEQAERTFQKGQKSRWLKRFVLFFFIIITLTLLCYAGYFFWKTHAISGKINSQNKSSSLTQDFKSTLATIIPTERKVLAGENEGRINILLLGAAGEHKPGNNLTDTIMLMSIDTKEKKIALLSLPRDLYVNIPETNNYTKINSLYQIGLKNDQGIELLKTTVEKITGTPINYYIVANFDGFEKLIDDIGGVNVTVERDIYDTTYPGPNYSFETFSLKKGFHALDGKTALKYVRERHDDPEGDFGRAKRQQQVIQAVKNKAFSVQTFLNVFALNDILNTLGDNIKTNISFDEMESFLKLTRELDTQNIGNVVVDAWKKESLLKVSHVMVGSARAFILVPRVGNYSEIQEVAHTIFNNTEISKRKDEIANENASIVIINKSGDPALSAKIRTLLTDKLSLKQVRLGSSSGQTQDATTVADLTQGQKIYTLDELLKKLPATLETDWANSDQQSLANTDLVITLGKDLIDTYKYEEDSITDFNNAQNSQDTIDFTQQSL